MTTASLMKGDALTAFSISLGATFFPPAVMRMSFARSVILRWVPVPSAVDEPPGPGSQTPTSPVCRPTVRGQGVRGRLGVAEVAEERARMPGHDLSDGRVDADLRALVRLAHRAELDPTGRFAVPIAVFSVMP
jgi:hypothetical protein